MSQLTPPSTAANKRKAERQGPWSEEYKEAAKRFKQDIGSEARSNQVPVEFALGFTDDNLRGTLEKIFAPDLVGHIKDEYQDDSAFLNGVNLHQDLSARAGAFDTPVASSSGEMGASEVGRLNPQEERYSALPAQPQNTVQIGRAQAPSPLFRYGRNNAIREQPQGILSFGLPHAIPPEIHQDRNNPFPATPNRVSVFNFASPPPRQPAWAMDATTMHERRKFSLDGQPFKRMMLPMPAGSQDAVNQITTQQAARKTYGVRVKMWEMEQELQKASSGMATELYACSARIKVLEIENAGLKRANAELRRRLAIAEGMGGGPAL